MKKLKKLFKNSLDFVLARKLIYVAKNKNKNQNKSK